MNNHKTADFGNVWENAQISPDGVNGIDFNNIMKPYGHRIMRITFEDEAEFTLRVNFPYPCAHGQFCMLTMPGFGETPIYISGTGEGWAEFTVQKVVQLNDSLFKLREGDLIYLRGPFGRPWPFDEILKGPSRHLVVLAEESGICSMRTMVDYIVRHPDEIASMYVVAGFKDDKGILHHAERERWSQDPRFHVVYTMRETPSAGFGFGKTADHLDQIPFRSFGEDYHVVIAGPQDMMFETAAACVAHGADPDKIWVSLERKMQCALGKCGHCKMNETYICLDGPILHYPKAQALLD